MISKVIDGIYRGARFRIPWIVVTFITLSAGYSVIKEKNIFAAGIIFGLWSLVAAMYCIKYDFPANIFKRFLHRGGN